MILKKPNASRTKTPLIVYNSDFFLSNANRRNRMLMNVVDPSLVSLAMVIKENTPKI